MKIEFLIGNEKRFSEFISGLGEMKAVDGLQLVWEGSTARPIGDFRGTLQLGSDRCPVGQWVTGLIFTNGPHRSS